MIQTRQNELQGRGLLSYKRRKIWIIIDAIRIDAALIPQQAIIMQLCRAGCSWASGAAGTQRRAWPAGPTGA